MSLIQMGRYVLLLQEDEADTEEDEESDEDPEEYEEDEKFLNGMFEGLGRTDTIFINL